MNYFKDIRRNTVINKDFSSTANSTRLLISEIKYLRYDDTSVKLDKSLIKQEFNSMSFVIGKNGWYLLRFLNTPRCKRLVFR